MWNTSLRLENTTIREYLRVRVNTIKIIWSKLKWSNLALTSTDKNICRIILKKQGFFKEKKDKSTNQLLVTVF